MPTAGCHRAWSTQYGEDYNRRKIWAHHQYNKKKSKPTKLNRPQVPRATELVPPQYTRVYAENCYGFDDPMLDDLRLYDDSDPVIPGVNVQTQTYDLRDISSPVVLDTYNENLDTDDQRPNSAIIHLPAEADPVVTESVPIRNKTPELHWICWPEPKKDKNSKRPYTSLGFYTDRGYAGNQTPRNDKPLKSGSPVQYDPKIKSWTNVTVENDRKAVDAMFAMKRSQSFYEPSYKPMTSISVNEPPPKDTYTRYGSQIVDHRSLYQQNFYPYYQAHGTGPRDAMHLQEVSKEMNTSQSPAFNYNYSFNKYPLHMRKNRRSAAVTDDYVHERSMFMTTTPQCVGHFIIHPDWVSERSSLRRSKSMLQLRSSNKY